MITRFLTARFSHRLILSMLLATIPAMLVGTWILSRKAMNNLRAAGVQRLAFTAERLASRVDNWTGRRGPRPAPALPPSGSDRHESAATVRLLQQFRKLYPQVSYAHTIGPDGINIARADDKPPVDYRDRECFRRVMAGAQFAREAVLRSRSTGHAAIDQAAPILDPRGKVLGVVVVGMDLGALGDVVGACAVAAAGIRACSTNRGARWRTRT